MQILLNNSMGIEETIYENLSDIDVKLGESFQTHNDSYINGCSALCNCNTDDYVNFLERQEIIGAEIFLGIHADYRNKCGVILSTSELINSGITDSEYIKSIKKAITIIELYSYFLKSYSAGRIDFNAHQQMFDELLKKGEITHKQYSEFRAQLNS